jgi:phosphate transport system substrate-binding protein
MSSRELTSNESEVLAEYNIALDGIAVIVHPTLDIPSLTVTQVADIYTGKISNWKEVGGPDMAIDVVAREAGSGTRDTFEEKVLKREMIIDTALQQPSNGALRTTVAGLPSAIGFISIGYLDNSVKGIAFDGIEPTMENVMNGRWQFQRPLLLLTRGEAKSQAKEFIDFCRSPEGQQIVDAEGYGRID